MNTGIGKTLKGTILLCCLVILSLSQGCSLSSERKIQKLLEQPHEECAQALMGMIEEKRFDVVDAVIRRAIEEKRVTRDGFRFFRAILEDWFFASEVLEFRRTRPVPQKVLPLLDTWIKENPDSDIAHVIRGVFYIEQAWEIRKRGFADTVSKEQWKSFYELHELAQKDLEKAYALNPSNPHSSRQLIRIQRALDAEDTEATDLYFSRAVKDDPTFYWAYRAKMENMMPKWGGEWKEMFNFALESAQSAPHGSLLPHLYAHAIEELGERSKDTEALYRNPKAWKVMEGIYRQIIEAYPRSTRWRIRFAKTANRAGKAELYAQLLEEAEGIDPNDARVCEFKARLAKHQKQWKTQEEYARRLIDSSPAYYYGFALLGYSQIKRKRFDVAANNYTAAIRLNPDKSSSWARRCHCYNENGEYEKALQDCTQAIKIRDGYAYAYKQRGIAHVNLGNTEAAETDLDAYNKFRKK